MYIHSMHLFCFLNIKCFSIIYPKYISFYFTFSNQNKCIWLNKCTYFTNLQNCRLSLMLQGVVRMTSQYNHPVICEHFICAQYNGGKWNIGRSSDDCLVNLSSVHWKISKKEICKIFYIFGDIGSPFAHAAFKTDCIKTKYMLQCTDDIIAVFNTALTKDEPMSPIM